MSWGAFVMGAISGGTIVGFAVLSYMGKVMEEMFRR